MRSRDQVGPDVRWMSRLEAAERALGEAEQRRATMSRLEAAERALGEAEQRATTASALSASRESERTVNELIAKHAPRGLRLHWEQQQPSGRAACELVMWQRVRSSWSAPTLSCWGPQPTPGRTGKLQMLTPDGELVEEQLVLLDDDAAAERLTHLQSVEHL